MEGDRVLGCVTRSGLRLEADWFIDATGPSRLIGRAAGIGVREYAVPRVCLWTQATAPRARAGTTLSLDTTKEQLEWVWEIPLAEDRQSLGLVMPSRAFRALERRGRSKAQILAEQLARFPRYASLEPDDLGEVRTRSYRPYVSDRVVGANWLMAGEAAAMIDPLTSFGVTAALRNGSEAASIITGTHGRAGTQRALADYDRRVRTLGDLYNSAIEALIYEPRVRMAFGLRAAGIAYVLVGYGTNTLYTRLRPTTATKTAVLAIIASAFRLWRRAWLVAADRGGTRQARSAATD
jgi:flavin-dependent dehydrogenase